MSHFVGNWTFPVYSALPALGAISLDSPWSELNARISYALFMHKLYEAGRGDIADAARRNILSYMDMHAAWFVPCEKSKIYLVRNYNGQSGALMINTVPR